MKKLIISGSGGRMGRCVTENAAKYSFEVTAGFDLNTPAGCAFPVYESAASCPEKADVLIDFSSPAALDDVLTYCIKNKMPAVLATTGYSEKQLQAITDAAKVIPLFRSANMSIGINLLLFYAKTGAELLGKDFDIELIEKHHRMKADAPSGTALMIADAVNSGLDEPRRLVCGRSPASGKRTDDEIGIHSIRGGTIVGEHELIFAGNNETFELKHTVTSREVFAIGALRAAGFLIGKEPRLFSMNDLIMQQKG